MPNICNGYVTIKGKAKDIENFCKLFIFVDEEGINIKKDKYFARSFVQQDWKSFQEEYIKDYELDEVTEISFNVDFAWSCWSCIFEGYPDGKECVTLEWACKEYNVEVVIETEEEGNGFEEKIYANKENIDYDSVDMPIHTCVCGNRQSIPSSYDISEYDCCICGKTGKWGDELKRLMEKKIENGNM